MSMFQTAQFAMISMLSIAILWILVVSIKSKGYQLNTSQYTLETITERYTHIQSYKEKLLLSMAYQLLMHNKSQTLQQLEQRLSII